MGYQVLLLDLDDTLLDFGANERESLGRLFQQHGYAFDALFPVYQRVNQRLWSEHEDGKIALRDVLDTRFARTLAELGQTVDGVEWEAQYREYLSGGLQLMPGAVDVCRRLAATHRLFIVTNGVAETQMNRLRMTGLLGLFEDVFISQAIGYQKPSRQFFDHVMGHIPGFDRRGALVIGDSLNTDIKGGILAGIDTCWLNSQGAQCPRELRGTYEITVLKDLYSILLGAEEASTIECM